MMFDFSLVVGSPDSNTRYTCHRCGVTEFGGSLGNPGLFGRMRQHLREADNLDPESRLQPAMTRISETTFSVTLQIVGIEQLSAEKDDAPREAEEGPLSDQLMPEKHLYRRYIVDANCVNARKKLPAMNKLEQWATDGLIELLTTQVAQQEMLAGNDAARKKKAYSFIFTESTITTDSEARHLRELGAILFPGGPRGQKQRNDAENVFNASKYMAPLITNDGDSKSQPRGILGARTVLADRGIQVLRPEELVAEIEALIASRDECATKMAALLNVEVPEWVGRD